jgi:glycosyltransferase involved in cell wall biosynthesis
LDSPEADLEVTEIMISVVIVTLGERPDELNDCIAALRSQTLRDFEVIIVLPKGSPEPLLHSFNTRKGGVSPISLIRMIHQDGYGICNARNNGIDASRGKIIAFTDDDAEPYPEWLAMINACFEAYPYLDYLGGEFTLEVKNVWQRWIDHNYHLSQVDIDRGLCHGNNMAYRREVFDNHRFDENIAFGADEADLQMRLNASGLKCMTFPDIQIRHEHRTDFISFSKMRWKYAQGHVYLIEDKLKQSLFHWDDLINIGFFASIFYSVFLYRVSPLFLLIPLALLFLIARHEYRSTYTFGTWLVQIYVTILWTISKMYYSFLFHLRRWGY